jgi:hypothetical protein
LPTVRPLRRSTSTNARGIHIANAFSRRLFLVVYLAAGSVALSWVALLNGAPLVFSDTMSYATAAFEREVPGLFSIFYSAFILPLHQGITFWPVIIVQGAILAHVLYLTARTVSGGAISKSDTFLILMLLAVFSALPWVSGELLPDAFTSVVLLGLFLLAFASDELSPGELVYISLLTTMAISFHFSHVPIAAGGLILCVILRFLWLGRPHRIGRWISVLLFPFGAALFLLLAVNVANSDQFVISRNSNVFLLAKLLDEGPALSYLEEACPQAHYALCGYLSTLKGKSHDELKWGAESPFKKVGSFDELEPEARSIVWGTLLSRPREIFRHALKNGALQLSRFQAGDGLTPEFAVWVGEHVGRVYGKEVGRPFLQSNQRKGQLPITQFRCLHLAGLAIAAAVWLWLLGLRWRALTLELRVLFVYIFGVVLWSALVSASLSGAYDRYLARVIWLVCFVALTGLLQMFRVQTKPSSEPAR